MTQKPTGFGIKDVDLFYFDPSDLSYEVEDKRIRQGQKHFSSVPVPVEIRNQARVHLWFEKRFGTEYPRLNSTDHSINHFASKTHAVGLRLEADGSLDLCAPFGLNDIFSFRLSPNAILNNRETHEIKGQRAITLWPEVDVIQWPD